MPKSKIEFRSTAAQEILSRMPNWTVRWGITLISSILTMLLFLAWLIKYPDIVRGDAILTTQTPTVKLVSKINGTLETLFVNNGAIVSKDTTIAKINNPISEQALVQLKTIITRVEEIFKNESHKSYKRAHNIFPEGELTFGRIQDDYNSLRKLFEDYIVLMENILYKTKNKHINSQIINYKRLKSIFERQLVFAEKNFENQKIQYEIYCDLYHQNCISKMEFSNKEAKYLEQQKNLEDNRRALVQNNIQINEYELQLHELNLDNEENHRILKNSINATLKKIKTQIQQWQQDYLLKSPVDGTVFFLNALHEKQYVKNGEELFAITPQAEQYIVQAQVSSLGLGKVKLGQKARVKVTAYPYQENGFLIGIVKEIAVIPRENKYKVILILENNSISAYGKTLSLKPDMSASVEIITENMSVLKRISNKIFGIAHRSYENSLKESKTSNITLSKE